MRRLYLIPIIHTSADMGSLALALEARATAELGQGIWQKHKEVVSDFWDSIDQFLQSLDVKGFKVYQDGLVANGEEGLSIVRQGVSEGSRNYQIVAGLLQRGATLVRTEDVSVVKKEYELIRKMAQAKSLRQREITALRYRLARGGLLAQRDNFIATRVNETLEAGETGILFIGAYHDVLPKLARDIKVTQVKEVAKVKEYHQALIGKMGRGQSLQQLAEYLSAPTQKVSDDCARED